MLTSILIGLDGSTYSNVAVELGIQWAKRFNALLVGLGIVDEPTICKREAVPLGGAVYKRERDERLLADGRRKVEEFLERFAAQCAAAGVAHREVEDVGMPYEEILRESHRYDLVLLGHETHFHFETSDAADETLWHVLRSESRPVVVAPAELQPGNSVVVAYNESPQADRALQAFQASGLDCGEEVYVTCVAEDEDQAAREADRGVAFLRSHDIRAVAVGRKPAGSVEQTILDEARARQARLLVMGACGHSRLREVLLGSVTKALLRGSTIPVFLCD
jgi:nucleotide-binding universal stress UspA family protein